MDQEKGKEGRGAFVLLAAAAILEAVTLALYALTGVSEFSQKLSLQVLLFSVAAAAAGIALLIPVRKGTGKAWSDRLLGLALYAVYALALLAWLFYIVSQLNYIANIVMGIDGTKLSPVFVITTVMFAAAWVLALLSARAFGGKAQETSGAGEGEEVQHG